jgi:hypothetical protein
MGDKFRFATEQGTIVVTEESIVIPATTGGMFEKAGAWASLLGKVRTIKAEDMREVVVAGRDRQYMTGKRAAGIVLTGGVAMLAPSRMRGVLIISTKSGDVFEFTLKRANAKRPEAIAAVFSSRGYVVI